TSVKSKMTWALLPAKRRSSMSPSTCLLPSRGLIVGGSKLFECQVTGTPEIDIYWFKEGSEILPSDRHKLAFVNSVASLELCSAELKDGGLYYCEARNEAGSESCKLTPADIVKGSGATFECQVAGTAPFEITWHKDGKEIRPSAKHGFSQVLDCVALEVHRCDVVDVGEYQCTVANEVGSWSHHFHNILTYKTIPPSFSRKLKDCNMVVGSCGELECKVSGSPPFTISWYHDSEEVQSGPNQEISFSDNTCTLRVPTLKLSDSGTYRCKAVNKAGSSETSASLVVKGQFLPRNSLIFTETASTLEGTATFIAKVGGDPIPSVKWMKGKWRQVTHGGRISMEQRGQEAKLEIREVTKSDSGQYRCVASNKHGEIECSADMHVDERKEAAHLEGDLRAKLKKYECPAALLPCSVASSLSSVRLTHRLHSLFSLITKTSSHYVQITLSTVTLNHTGTYLLTVSNPAGTKTVALNVTVLDVPAAPIGPANILDVTPDSMTIEWRPPKDDGGTPVTNYIVEKREANKGTWGGVSSGSLATQLKICRLQRGTEYVVRIRAENKMGIGAPLESKPTVAEHSFMPPSPPGKPQTSDLAEDAVTVGWTMPLSDGGSQITGYIIERRHKGGKWIRVNKTPCRDLRYRVLGLFEGSEYEFRVFAENIAGFSGPSPISDPCKPCRPITVPITGIGADKCRVVWDAPEDDGGCEVDSYILEKCETRRMVWSTYSASVVTPYCNVTRLVEGNEYIFRVRAENKMGTGPSMESKPVTVKTQFNRPGPPEAPEVTKVSHSVR
uniref:Uncharacterized protein n=1 Tax=Salarias fasciatus TaxID=181472 RepID=A0A672I7Y4_SALFA